MSGILGILHLDGSPIDRSLLERLTNSLLFRGPDAQRIWCRGPVGFGHALLQTAAESTSEFQPFTVDSNSWIVSDARVDGRSDLIAKLQSRGHENLDQASDAELILRAYQVWDERCVDHLLGDFVFAIWNARRRRLFCARDHFGMKPLFYVRIGHTLVFSNTMDCLRRHPGVSARINELAIADFLLFDNNQDLSSSAFADILRLPPAHALECQDGVASTRRYWRLPEVAEVNYRRPEDCLDRFRQVMDAAVSDRLRSDSAGILLSGGLDSPTVAASACRVLKRRNSTFDLRACIHFHEHLIPHEERHYGGLVANALGLPVQFVNGDNCHMFDAYDDPDYRTPEPNHFPMGFRNANPFEQVSRFSRTVLSGYGGDPALASLLSAHFRRRFRKRQFALMFRDAAGYLSADGRLSRLYVRARWRRWFGKQQVNSAMPSWLRPEFVKRLNLRDRWETTNAATSEDHGTRPEAHANLSSPYWTHNFEPFDPGITGINVESSHPFFDLRVLTFLLSLPALPWCSDKEILRQVERGVLPDAIRLRRKSPLIRDPILALLQKPESAWVDSFEPVPELLEYVQRDRIPPVHATADQGQAWTNLKPLSLNFWLHRRDLTDRVARGSADEVVTVGLQASSN